MQRSRFWAVEVVVLDDCSPYNAKELSTVGWIPL
jgi:hypothetical protein